jgi:hypothetical protein
MNLSLVDEAIEISDEILDLVVDLPDQADDFAASIQDTTIDIRRSIEDRNFCSEHQIVALRNMLKGVKKWFKT